MSDNETVHAITVKWLATAQPMPSKKKSCIWIEVGCSIHGLISGKYYEERLCAVEGLLVLLPCWKPHKHCAEGAGLHINLHQCCWMALVDGVLEWCTNCVGLPI